MIGAIRRPWLALSSAVAIALILVNLGARTALAVSYNCDNCDAFNNQGYCYAGQQANFTTATGIDGYITDPSVSGIPLGDDHISLYMLMSSPSGPSNIQAGFTIGELDGILNNTGKYEISFEDTQPAGNGVIGQYFPQYSISQNAGYDTEIYYDGMNGHLGYPQFQAVVDGHDIDAAEIATDHARPEAIAEILANDSECPTLTSGSPWQNFGADYSGTASGNTEMYLSTNSNPLGHFSLWTGDPTILTGTTANNPFYWYSDVNGASAFQTNGPSGGPA